jgi:HAD superfamily hydrolase (TIGR01509 family)
MTIKTIIFDNNGVLTSSFTEKPLIKMAEYLTVSKETLITACTPYVIPLDTGKLTQYDFCANIIKDLNSDKSISELSSIHLESFDLNPEAISLAKKLSNEFNLSLLTNFGDGFWEANKRWQLDLIFKKQNIFISAELGMLKPALEIYEYALSQMRALPSETVFIDDAAANVNAAIQLGMYGIHFHNTEQLISELARLR